MSSISASSLYNKTNADYQLRKIAEASANVFTQSVLQISDQQSRDKEYEKSLEWIRSYIASLQAKLNTLIEELNVIYEQMLNELMYKKADSKNTEIITNAYLMPSLDNCLPYIGVAPELNLNVKNFQYNPFFGSRAIGLDNFDRNNTNNNTIGRTYYENNLHHELGNSFYSTLGYLWMWDVDRINASYATTMDRYIKDGKIWVSKNDPLISYVNDPNEENNDNDNIGYDPMLDIVGSQGHNPEKYQVNVAALQPNRGVFAPGVESKADQDSYALYEGFENSGVLKSLNLFDPNTMNLAGLQTNSYTFNHDDCKWTQVFVNPYDRDQGKMSEHLQWRVVRNRSNKASDPNSNGSIFFGDPTGTNYNYEYYVVKDHVENTLPNSTEPLSKINGPAFGDDYIDALSGNLGDQYDDSSSHLFDTYGIPKNYPDPDNPASRFNHYPQNKDTDNNTLTDLIKGGSSIESNPYFVHKASQTGLIPTAPNQALEDTDKVKVVQNADFGNWTHYYVRDKRDTSDTLSSSWRIVDETTHPGGVEAFSGEYSYYFGNSEGNYGTAGMDPVVSGHSFTLHWSGLGDQNDHCSFFSPLGCLDTFDIPTFQMTLNGITKTVKGHGGDISFSSSEFIEGENKLWVKLADIDYDAWKSIGAIAIAMGMIAGLGAIGAAGVVGALLSGADVPAALFTGPYNTDNNKELKLKYSRYGLNTSNQREEKTISPDIKFDMGFNGWPLPDHEIWGIGRINGDGDFEIPEYPNSSNSLPPFIGNDPDPLPRLGGVSDQDASSNNGRGRKGGTLKPGGLMINPSELIAIEEGNGYSSSNYTPGLKIENYKPYRSEGFMARKLDLSHMAGMQGSEFSRLELRYRQNFQTEEIDNGDNPNGLFDKRLALEYTGGAYYTELPVDSNINYSGVTYTSQRQDARESSNGWEQVYYKLTPGFGKTDQQIALYFDSVDQFRNKEFRGWNVDDIEVVARGRSRGELISPKIDLSQYQNAVLEFDSRFISQTRDRTGTAPKPDTNDKISVYYSTDGGQTWNLINDSNKSGSEKDESNNNIMPNHFYRDNSEPSQSTEYWTTVKYDLPCVAGSSDVRVKFVFECDEDNNEGQGWNVDNVKVYGKKNAATDFYAYKQEINSKFVTDGVNQSEVFNKNRPNISFDPRGTNIKGRFDEGINSRIEITNTDFPAFSNTLLTYVEQDAAVYNANKVSSYAVWDAPATPTAVAVLDSSAPNGLRVETTKNVKFYKDSLGRLINSDGQMYIDRAMAINLGLVKDVIPTKQHVNNKLTGWVNYDPNVKGMTYVDDTCFEEGTSVPGGENTYEFMTTFIKKTIGLTASEASGNKTLQVKVKGGDAFLYVNGEQITQPTPTISGEYKIYNYTIPSGKLKEGFNTIMLQQSYGQGADGIEISSSDIPHINNANSNKLDETWAVRMYEGGFKGRDASSTPPSYFAMGQNPSTGLFSQELYDAEKVEYFGQEQEELKSLVLNFKNTDGKGVGILSEIHEIELVSTGEPTIQSFETKEFTTSTINDNGPLYAVLNYGYIDGKQVMGDDPRAFNVAYKEHLNFTTDTDGFASITLSAKGGNSMVNDATVLLKVHYFDDEDQDGVIDIDDNKDGILSDAEISYGISNGKRKTKYIGAEDRRDTSYYTSPTVGYSGTEESSLATGVYNRFEIVGEIKLYAPVSAGSNTITLTTPTGGTTPNSKDKFLPGDKVKLGNQTLTVLSATGNNLTFTQNIDSNFSAGTIAYTNSYTGISNKKLRTDVDPDYAFKVYNNLVTASKGRSGGSTIEENKNKLTEKIKAILDSQEYQEVLKYGLLDNVIIAATTNSSRGDQIVGKIILDWDWRKRRVKVTQGAFSAVYKS